jgi:uroporphyrin-3 C-methyltransferase
MNIQLPSESSESIPRPNPLARLLSRMNLTQLTLVVLSVFFVWQWLEAHSQINQIQQELGRRLADADGNAKANQALLAHNQEVVRELGGKLSVLENKYAESQNQRAALETLYHEMSSSRDQMALAEVEQAVLMAGQQLQLAGNVRAALIALQQADARLQRVDRGALSGLRKMIASDIDKLRALPNVDVQNINARLNMLIAVVDTLPMTQDAHVQQEITSVAAPVNESAWHKFWRESWQELKPLVRIENMDKPELPLLSPTQSYFLRENLRLRLLTARLSLLSHDEASFKRDLKTAQEWIWQYFDVKSERGTAALATLQKISSAHLLIDLPDLTGSLEAVRNYRISHEKGMR